MKEIFQTLWKVAFLADVHPEEAFRDLGTTDSKIQNFMLEVVKDVELYEKFKQSKPQASMAKRMNL